MVSVPSESHHVSGISFTWLDRPWRRLKCESYAVFHCLAWLEVRVFWGLWSSMDSGVIINVTEMPHTVWGCVQRYLSHTQLHLGSHVYHLDDSVQFTLPFCLSYLLCKMRCQTRVSQSCCEARLHVHVHVYLMSRVYSMYKTSLWFLVLLHSYYYRLFYKISSS